MLTTIELMAAPGATPRSSRSRKAMLIPKPCAFVKPLETDMIRWVNPPTVNDMPKSSGVPISQRRRSFPAPLIATLSVKPNSRWARLAFENAHVSALVSVTTSAKAPPDVPELFPRRRVERKKLHLRRRPVENAVDHDGIALNLAPVFRVSIPATINPSKLEPNDVVDIDLRER